MAPSLGDILCKLGHHRTQTRLRLQTEIPNNMLEAEDDARQAVRQLDEEVVQNSRNVSENEATIFRGRLVVSIIYFDSQSGRESTIDSGAPCAFDEQDGIVTRRSGIS